MDFEKRLEKAIERGERARDEQGRRRAEKTMGEEELKTLHTRCRLELSDHIEKCLRKLADHFPGFDFQTLVDEQGWGAKISRDDLIPQRGTVHSLYSRLEMVIRPFSPTHIVELATKGTIRNKEILSRNHYQFLAEIDVESFKEMIDLWILEYAEKFSATK